MLKAHAIATPKASALIVEHKNPRYVIEVTKHKLILIHVNTTTTQKCQMLRIMHTIKESIYLCLTQEVCSLSARLPAISS